MDGNSPNRPRPSPCVDDEDQSAKSMGESAPPSPPYYVIDSPSDFSGSDYSSSTDENQSDNEKSQFVHSASPTPGRIQAQVKLGKQQENPRSSALPPLGDQTYPSPSEEHGWTPIPNTIDHDHGHDSSPEPPLTVWDYIDAADKHMDEWNYSYHIEGGVLVCDGKLPPRSFKREFVPPYPNVITSGRITRRMTETGRPYIRGNDPMFARDRWNLPVSSELVKANEALKFYFKGTEPKSNN